MQALHERQLPGHSHLAALNDDRLRHATAQLRLSNREFGRIASPSDGAAVVFPAGTVFDPKLGALLASGCCGGSRQPVAPMSASSTDAQLERASDNFASEVEGKSERTLSGRSGLLPALAPATLERSLRSSSAPLPAAVRRRYQHDFSQVRVHTGKEANRAASLIGADAFAIGNDIVLRDGAYQPQARSGRQLLAHELGHVVQQRTIGARLQLRVNGDITRISINPGWAADLTKNELIQQLEILRQHISKLPDGSAERAGAMENLGVLERDMYRRQGTAGASPSAVTPAGLGASAGGPPKTQGAGQSLVPRPPGLPLAQGFVLQPVVGTEATALAASLPEGRMVTLPSIGKGGAGGGFSPTTLTGGVSGGFVSVNMGVNAALRSGGFAAAGENAIGVVAIPRWFTPGNLIPETANAWGHTAVYARIGSEIQVVRGFTVANVGDTILNASAIRSGMRPTAGMFAEDASLFTNTSAMSIEYPVTAEVAEALAKGLPPPGPAGMQYFAQPAVKCVGTNCVLWAVEQAEQKLGGRIGPAVEGGVSPITSAVGKGGADVAGTASQGKLYEFMGDVATGERQAGAVPSAVGEAVAGGMPRGLTYLKWGGRAFIVISIALIPVEVAMAPKGKRVRTAVGAGSAFVGGLAGGALAGLACGPGAPVCSVVLGLGFGIGAAILSRSVAEDVYDVINEE